MSRYLRTGPLIALASALAAAALPCSSEPLRYDGFERGDREFSLTVGFGANHRIPDATESRFKFDTVKLRYGVFTSPRTQLAVDLASGFQRDEPNNTAVWVTTSYRRYFAVRGSTALGYDFNFGILRMNKGVPELGTRTNFTEQLGLVLQHGVTEDSAWTLEYKFSHVSNAGIKLPNVGINASMFSAGYSWYR